MDTTPTRADAAYALDALDADETRAYEEHLAGCDAARTSSRSSPAAARSRSRSPPVEPPPELRERILEAARAERPNVVPLRPGAGRPTARATVAAVVAIAACAVIGLGVWNVALHDQLDDAGRRCAACRCRAPTGSVVVGAGGPGRARRRRTSTAAPAGKTYEAWVIAGGAAAPAGTFGGGGTTVVKLEQPVRVGRGRGASRSSPRAARRSRRRSRSSRRRRLTALDAKGILRLGPRRVG